MKFAERLRMWRMQNQLSESHAAAKLRKATRLQITLVNYRAYELGHAPDPENLWAINKVIGI
jgi:transcriptional regulator with XRE-family HTH domain